MNVYIILFLTLAVLTILLAISFLVKVIHYAKRASLHILGGAREHKKWVDRFLCLLVIPVLLIESIVRLEGGRWGSSSLFTVHVYFIVIFVVTIFSMRIIWTGSQNPYIHRILSYFFFVSFVGVAGTGGALVVQLLMKL